MEPSAARKPVEVILRRVGDLPSLPDVINKIIDLLGRPQTPASEIARLISYDPGLTSKFLRMVNSAAYGFPRQISSVQHAIMILGFNMVRGVVLSASIFKILEGKRTEGLDPSEFWRHSIGTAIASRIIATQWKTPYADDAFSAGMLHDIGKMMLDHYFAQEYQQVIQLIRKANRLPHGEAYRQIEEAVLGFDHAFFGYQLALKWRLPGTFAQVIRYHHAPQNAEDALDLVYVVTLANTFSQLVIHNYGVFTPDWIPESVLSYFQFDPENPRRFEQVFELVKTETDSIDELLNTLNQ